MVAVSAQLKRLNQSGVQDWRLAPKLKRLKSKIQDNRGKIESGGPKIQDRALEI